MRKNTKRVVMISYSFYQIDDRIRRHVANLLELGYEVDLISLCYKDDEKYPDEEGVRFFRPMRRSYRKSQLQMLMAYIGFGLRCSLIMLRTHLFQKRIALIHVNNMPNFLVFAALPLRLLGVKVLLDVHDALPENYQEKCHGLMLKLLLPLLYWEERLSMWFANYVICTEHTKFGRLLQNGLKKDKGMVVMNAADPKIWKREAVGGSQSNSSNYRLVYHGTLARRLGLDTAILAVKDLASVIPDIRFDIYGDGDQRADLVNMVHDLNLQDHIFFSEGFVSVLELPGLLKDADVAIVPARDCIAFKYNLSGKLLEYVVFEIPCIATDTFTHTHYFNSNQMKFFHSDDVEALKKHILFLYEHPEERERLVKEAKKFLELHNYESECGAYKNVIQCLVNNNMDDLRKISDSCRV